MFTLTLLWFSVLLLCMMSEEFRINKASSETGTGKALHIWKPILSKEIIWAIGMQSPCLNKHYINSYRQRCVPWPARNSSSTPLTVKPPLWKCTKIHCKAHKLAPLEISLRKLNLFTCVHVCTPYRHHSTWVEIRRPCRSWISLAANAFTLWTFSS